MNTMFVDILKKLLAEQGKEALLNSAKCKAFLADYTKGDYKKESRLLLQALEAGVQKAIDTADKIELCKQQQIKVLQDEHFLAAEAAADVVDTLVLVLREGQESGTSQDAVCSNCGKELQKEWKACPYCLTPVASAVPQNNPVPDQTQQQSVNNVAKPIASFRSDPISFVEGLGGVYKKYVVNTEGHEIKAVYNTSNTLQLFVDDCLIAQKGKLLNFSEKGDIPRVSVKYPFQSGEATIDVYVKFGVLNNQLKICINGIFVGGDLF